MAKLKTYKVSFNLDSFDGAPKQLVHADVCTTLSELHIQQPQVYGIFNLQIEEIDASNRS